MSRLGGGAPWDGQGGGGLAVFSGFGVFSGLAVAGLGVVRLAVGSAGGARVGDGARGRRFGRDGV